MRPGIFIGLPGGGRRAHGCHQPLGIGVLRGVYDDINRALFLDFPVIEHHDIIRDLCHNGQVMGHVNRGSAFFLDHLFE